MSTRMSLAALWMALLIGLLLPAAQACGPLRLAMLPYPGFYEPAAGASPAGIDPVIAELLSQRSGCRLEIHASTVARLWPELQAGLTDLATGITYLPERREQADYLWLLRGRSLVLLSAQQAQRTPTRADFDADPELRLGVTRGGHRGTQAQAWVDALRAQGRVSESEDMASLLRAYAAGRVQAVLLLPGNEQTTRRLAAHALLDWLPQDRFTAGWVLSRTTSTISDADRGRLLAAAASLQRDGSLKRLLRQHFANPDLYEYLPAR